MGYIFIDVKEWGVDMLVVGIWKYLFGILGMVFFYVRKELVDVLKLKILVWFGWESGFDVVYVKGVCCF